MLLVPTLRACISTTLPDAPVTTVEYDGDDARPLQDLPRTKL